MLVNPMTFSQGGGESPVVSTGLVIREKNDGTPQEPKTFVYQNDISASSSADFTCEVCGDVSGLPSGQTWGYNLAFGSGGTSTNVIISVSLASADIPTGGEWGLLVTINGYDYRTSAVLLFDTKYTITLKMSSGTLSVYVNGTALPDTITESFNYSGNKVGVYRRNDTYTNSDRTVNGEWNEFRIYNRALTDAEILANYNADTANYGT